MLGNVREQRQSLKGSSERESEQREQERRAGSRGRSMRSRSREQGAGAERAGSVSEEQAARERAARAGSSGSRSKEWGARGARCARTIGACTMLVAVCSAVEQALHRLQRTIPNDRSSNAQTLGQEFTYSGKCWLKPAIIPCL